MPFGNSERSWFDEFWSLWHLDRDSDLEVTRPRDLWAYDDKPKEPTRIIVDIRNLGESMKLSTRIDSHKS